LIRGLAPRSAALLLAAAAVLLLPSLLLGTMISHSSPQNLTWAAQFAEQFRAGVLYPRWMSDSFDGLGGPAFYFYPPLPFWLDGLVSIVTFNVLPAAHRLPITWLLLLWASGLAMHAWLRHETQSGNIALWGALAYMAAPYHLFDHYTRGALAEFAAYAFVPLVLLFLRRPIPLAVAFAALLLSHLPTALLVSLAIVAPYALLTLRAPRAFLGAALGAVLGIGLAAIYLVPALTLQSWISADQLWTSFYQARRWLLLPPDQWPDANTMQIVAMLAAGYVLVALGVCVFFRHRRGAALWAALGLLCLVLMSGLVPFLWDLPLLAKVQFPWRLLLAVEFAVISAVCLAAVSGLGRAGLYIVAAALLFAIPAGTRIASDVADRVAYTRKGGPLAQQDAKEYEPRGYPLADSPAYAQLGLEPLASTLPVACTPTPRTCRADAGRFGTMLIEVDGEVPTAIVLRRFFFPAWRLEPAAALAPTAPLQLLSFVTPPGHRTYRLERHALPSEQWGWAISGASLILLLAAAAFSARSNPR
jgi:hypothetical protein